MAEQTPPASGTQPGSIYVVRKKLPDGRYDTLELGPTAALLQGEGVAITRKAVEDAMWAIAKTNGLTYVKIVESVDPAKKEHKFTYTVVGRNGKPDANFKPWVRDWQEIAEAKPNKEVVLPANAVLKEDGTYDCVHYEFREANPRVAIQPGRELKKPESYKGYQAPGPQVLADCVECIIPKTPTKVAGFLPEVPPAPTVDQPMAKLVNYPTGGNLSNGNSAQIYDAAYLPILLGVMPNRPHVAARGSNARGVGLHSTTDVLGLASRAAPWAPIPLGPVTVIPIGLDLSNLVGASNDRLGHSREGSNATNQNDISLENRTRVDLSPITEAGVLRASRKTRTDATLLPFDGVMFNTQGQLVDTPGYRYNQNHIYFIEGEGENAPAITSNNRFQNKGKHNLILQGKPSGPVVVTQTNYVIAEQVDSLYVLPRMEALNADLEKNFSKEGAQELLALHNLRMNLTGISNYPINADISKPIDPKNFDKLNIREQIAYNKARLIEHAAAQGITGLDTEAVATPRSLNKEEFKAMMVDYYSVMAVKDSRTFREFFKRNTGEKADYDTKKPEEVAAVARHAVNTMEAVKTYPEQGIALSHLQNLYLAPRSEMNAVERREIAVTAPPADAKEAVGKAMNVIAGSPGAVQALLAASADNPDIATAFANRDNFSIQVPKWYGNRDIELNRLEAVAAVRQRGYSDDVMKQHFTVRPTNGILRNLPALQQELAASATNPDIVALRANDLRDMITDGAKKGTILRGAHANEMLYALAVEKDLATMHKIEAQLRQDNPAEAEGLIDQLRQGVLAAKETLSARQMSGVSHDTLSAQVAAVTATTTPTAAIPLIKGPVAEFVKAAKSDAATRDVAMATAFFTTPETNATALAALQSQPESRGLATAAVVTTLAGDSELAKTVLKNLRRRGDRSTGLVGKVFNDTDRHTLAARLDDFVDASNAGDAKKTQAAADKLNAFIAEPKHSAAVADLFAAVADSAGGNAALTATYTHALAAAGRGEATPIAGSSLNGAETLNTIYSALMQYDPSRSPQLSAAAIHTIKNMFTKDGNIIPFLVLPRPRADKPEKPEQPSPPELPGPCTTKCGPEPVPNSPPKPPVSPDPAPKPPVSPDPAPKPPVSPDPAPKPPVSPDPAPRPPVSPVSNPVATPPSGGGFTTPLGGIDPTKNPGVSGGGSVTAVGTPPATPVVAPPTAPGPAPVPPGRG